MFKDLLKWYIEPFEHQDNVAIYGLCILGLKLKCVWDESHRVYVRHRLAAFITRIYYCKKKRKVKVPFTI